MPENTPSAIVEHRHWVEQLGTRVIDRGNGPYIITGGMTTSGPVHMGTLCEMLYPQAVLRYLKQQGKKAQYLFIADILDAFDSVPASHAQYSTQLTPHLGKPLCRVPDPGGCHPNLGEHFLTDGFKLGEEFGVAPTLLRAQEIYATGKMDPYAALFMSDVAAAREVVASSSNNPNLSPDWSPIMPICQKCGRIATTRVTGYDPTAQTYTYSCDKNVKYTAGCGHSGSDTLQSHKYKITWRLDWPSRMDALGTSIEGAGVDHHTRGGSWDTAQAVFKNLFHKEPPIGYQFGFVLYMGKKYSKSKGNGMGVRELMSLIPAPVLAYTLLRPDLTENRDINPTPDNLLRQMTEYEEAGRLAKEMGLGLENTTLPTSPPPSSTSEISRADRKRALAYILASNRPLWSVSFTDLFIYYGLYNDLERVATVLGKPDDVRYLTPYVLEWEKQSLIPDIYRFKFKNAPALNDTVRGWAETLSPSMDALAIHNSVFTYARDHKIAPGEMFQLVYTDLIGKSHGPKIGRLVEILGVQTVRSALLAPKP